MVLPVIAAAIVIGIVAFVLFSHWTETYGDNHY
jgi:hypothetical protein